MRRILAQVVVCAAAAFGVYAVAAEPVKEEPATANISTFMRLKLSHSQQVLEGIAMEDFEQIAKHAQSMRLLSEDEKWMVFQTPEYRQHSLEFQQICRKLQTSADAKNLDGAALAYVQLTMSCVNCHKYTRGIRMASLPLGGAGALGR
jgi:hypothetical protein